MEPQCLPVSDNTQNTQLSSVKNENPSSCPGCLRLPGNLLQPGSQSARNRRRHRWQWRKWPPRSQSYPLASDDEGLAWYENDRLSQERTWKSRDIVTRYPYLRCWGLVRYQNAFILSVLCRIIMSRAEFWDQSQYRINLIDILCIKCKHVITVNIRTEPVSQDWQPGLWPWGWVYQSWWDCFKINTTHYHLLAPQLIKMEIDQLTPVLSHLSHLNPELTESITTSDELQSWLLW